MFSFFGFMAVLVAPIFLIPIGFPGISRTRGIAPRSRRLLGATSCPWWKDAALASATAKGSGALRWMRTRNRGRRRGRTPCRHAAIPHEGSPRCLAAHADNRKEFLP